jgi:hypothetical protein
MTERDNRAPISNRRTGLSQIQAVTDPATDDLDNDQVRRWAEVIVNGDTSDISHLTAGNRQRIEAEVRRRLRIRLMRLVARAVAQDILADKPHDGA